MYSDRNASGEPTTRTGSGYDMGSVPADVNTVLHEESAEVADLVERARSRADGFQYGDDRAIGSRPNWAARNSEQLYAYATVNNEPGTAEELGQTWGSHSSELSKIADDLYNAIKELGAAWVGQGAGAAQGALVGIANSSSQASEAAKTMQDRLGQQASAAAKLKTMPQPKEFDPGAETAAMLAGGPAAMVKDMKEQHDAAQAVKAQQIAFLDAYTEELSQIDGTTPSFGPESLGLKPLSSGVAAEAGRLGAVGTFTLSGVSGGVSSAHGGVPGVAVGGAADTAHGGADGGQGGRVHGMPGTGAGAGTGSGQLPSAPTGGGFSAGSALGAAAAGGALGYAGVKAAKTLSSGKRSGAKKDVVTSETVASANQTGSTSMVSQAQNQGSVAPLPGGVPGANPAATAAPMGMGGMGATGRQDGEKEHTHASFLIEPDPDATFGATESAAPPVLGAWDDDEGR
ncbi:hypothetical protein SAXI111661_16090 [Saccharomonospora xinjiangensis]|uniref:hypothetical protein n=1 Tax=Saccharomonospora xinjiangensis TaxID=75294 RepID=UPI00106F4DD6|nr:hypothetical protein [Saccharomonospora xinjiangensis]QBQ62297.1 hypothetical protein EYD13_19795 [Saccharomonospora xinjiangensis]